MKLMDIWNAREVWPRLASLCLRSAKLEYDLAKYTKRLSHEFEVIENKRVVFLYTAAGVPEGQPVEVKPGSPEYDEFATLFQTFLEEESTITVTPYTLAKIADAMDAAVRPGNVQSLSTADFVLLAPLFSEDTSDVLVN